MSTDSTAPAERGRDWSRWLRNLVIPALIAIAVGAVGGGAFYYFTVYRKTSLHHSNPSAARRVASDHMLVAIENEADQSAAVAMIGRTRAGPAVLTISPNLIVEVPGLGPRAVALAVRQAGAEAAAVAVANALRITVPAAMSAKVPVVAGTIDDLGPLTVDVPKELQSDAGTAFPAGPEQMSGDAFVRYMTGSFSDETEPERDNRQQAGWRALLMAATKQGAPQAFASWTSDLRPTTALALMRSCAPSPLPVGIPVTPVGLANESLVRIDDGGLPAVRRSLIDFTNGAETLDGRRIRLLVRASGAVGPVVGRILVNAGYVIEMSGKTTTTATLTRVAVAPSVPDAEATGKDIAGLLGMGLVKVSTDTSADTDIILTIGMDWAEANGFPQR